MEPFSPPVYPDDPPDRPAPESAEVNDRAFELAGAFITELLSELNGSVFGAVLLRSLGLDGEKSKTRQLAEEFSISRQTLYKHEQRCAELLRTFKRVPLPARGREGVRGNSQWLTRQEAASMFGVSVPFTVKFLGSRGVKPRKDNGTFLYPRAEIERIFIHSPPQGRREVGKRDTARGRALAAATNAGEKKTIRQAQAAGQTRGSNGRFSKGVAAKAA